MLPTKEADRENISSLTSIQKRSELGSQLARLQRELSETKKSMLVIVDGWESSGKGSLLKDLTQELEPKYANVSVFSEPSGEESQYPYLRRFFMKSPIKGHITFFDRSFYYDLFHRYDWDKTTLDHALEDISFVEEALANDDTLVVKFFLHQTKEEMKANIERLEKSEYQHIHLSDEDYYQLEKYDDFYDQFNHVLEQTNEIQHPWHILYVDNKEDTSRKALQLCIDELETHLASDPARTPQDLPKLPLKKEWPLSQIDLTQTLSDEEYEAELYDLQETAGNLLYQAYIENKPIIIVYEGTDASGKGGNYKRLTQLMDPRGYDISTVSSPTANESAHHYLWRFYRDFPRRGRMTIFDRSWYGRVLVERVEELIPEYRWKEAYQEINKMEHNLHHDGYLVLKYLLIIDKEEQLERFKDRAVEPDKQHKLTEDDWISHKKFDYYEKAMNEMVFYTSTKESPWKILSGQDKQHARLAVLRDFIKRVRFFLEKG